MAPPLCSGKEPHHAHLSSDRRGARPRRATGPRRTGEPRRGRRRPRPPDSAAGWLTGQLTDGLLFNDQFGFNDVGLSIDAALALDAVGGHEATVAEVADAAAAEIGAYVGDGTTESYAGALAKAVVLTALPAAGANPRNVGGVNLVQRLEDRVDATGRIADQSEFDDFANVLGQSYAVQGLDAVNSQEADAATDFLLSQQCAAGFFAQAFGSDCTADDASVDATAIAVLALQSQLDDTDVAPRVAAAVAWLVAAQRDNGSFGSDGEIATPNSNSSGLAGWALGVSGQTSSRGARGRLDPQAAVLRRPGRPRLRPCGARCRRDHGETAVTSGAGPPPRRFPLSSGRRTRTGRANVIGGADYVEGRQADDPRCQRCHRRHRRVCDLPHTVVSQITNGDGEAVLQVKLPRAPPAARSR